ncbi:hypothetical protein KUV41_11550 [Halomonas sp. DP8Y7-1]|uniref:hypothetical protein n=1 Tax=Halomonas sp. DP8Y7-1 TaxID=2859078 RepID=UPI001C9684D6|nr:hypothetical protein [Halomonas sp. DP8Y7-1]MBY6029992.1 hypothetical protein [Halomonas sp. DP8Y7-1]
MKERPWRRLYNTKTWYRLRTAQLREEPLCRLYQKMGRITAGQQPNTFMDAVKTLVAGK